MVCPSALSRKRFRACRGLVSALALRAMTSGADWQAQVGRNWARSWRETDRSFAGLTARLLDRIAAIPGDAIIDIGCGAGELSLALGRARPRARVTGIDVSADLIAAAQERAGPAPRARFITADAASWFPEEGPPDLLVSRHGVMFFADPVGAFTHLYGIAAPGAALAFSCFRFPRENPWAAELAALLELPPAADPYAPGPFAFADPQHVERILAAAGWQDVDLAPVDFAYVAGAGTDPVEDALAFLSRIGPAAAALRALDDDARALAEVRIRKWLNAHHSGGLVAYPAAAWIVTAHR